MNARAAADVERMTASLENAATTGRKRGSTMEATNEGNPGFYPTLTRMAIQFFDDALEATGDDRQAAMVASVALMAAVDRLNEARLRRERGGEPCAAR
jgi:hypothetical protein